MAKRIWNQDLILVMLESPCLVVVALGNTKTAGDHAKAR